MTSVFSKLPGYKMSTLNFLLLPGTLNQNLKRNLGHIEMHTGPPPATGLFKVQVSYIQKKYARGKYNAVCLKNTWINVGGAGVDTGTLKPHYP